LSAVVTEDENGTVVRFLCCRHTFNGERPVFDSDGFIICPEHGQRRYGWRSPRFKQHKAFPFDAANPQYIWRPDFSESRLEQDEAVVHDLFKDEFLEPVTETKIDLADLTEEELEILGRNNVKF
jgi:hypothetical protein